MKKRNLLLATLLVSVAFGLGSTNKANAQTNIRISGDGSAGSYDVGGISAYANTTQVYISDDVNASASNYDDTKTDWVQSPLDDHIYLESGGKLTTDVTQNGPLTASGGDLIINSGSLGIASGSTIENAVALQLIQMLLLV